MIPGIHTGQLALPASGTVPAVVSALQLAVSASETVPAVVSALQLPDPSQAAPEIPDALHLTNPETGPVPAIAAVKLMIPGWLKNGESAVKILGTAYYPAAKAKGVESVEPSGPPQPAPEVKAVEVVGPSGPADPSAKVLAVEAVDEPIQRRAPARARLDSPPRPGRLSPTTELPKRR